MTDQEVFDKVLAHLIAQKVRSVWGFNCAYRSPRKGGLKCAIGALIPDEEYDPLIENTPVLDLLSAGICPPSLKKMNPGLLADLQQLHDNGHHWTDSGLSQMGVAAADIVCRAWGLDPKSLGGMEKK